MCRTQSAGCWWNQAKLLYKSIAISFALFGALALLPHANAQSFVDTRIGPDIWGSASLNSASPYVGQDYIVQPSQTTLLSFSFWISGGEGSTFSASIYDLTTHSGALFTSEILPGIAGTVSAREYRFLTSGLTLTPFDLYVFLLHYEGGGGLDPLLIPFQPNSIFHGVALFSQDGINFFASGDNVDFRAEFQATPVPEPEAYAMMLAGLGLLGFAVRRRRQKEAAA